MGFGDFVGKMGAVRLGMQNAAGNEQDLQSKAIQNQQGISNIDSTDTANARNKIALAQETQNFNSQNAYIDNMKQYAATLPGTVPAFTDTVNQIVSGKPGAINYRGGAPAPTGGLPNQNYSNEGRATPAPTAPQGNPSTTPGGTLEERQALSAYLALQRARDNYAAMQNDPRVGSTNFDPTRTSGVDAQLQELEKQFPGIGNRARLYQQGEQSSWDGSEPTVRAGLPVPAPGAAAPSPGGVASPAAEGAVLLPNKSGKQPTPPGWQLDPAVQAQRDAQGKALVQSENPADDKGVAIGPQRGAEGALAKNGPTPTGAPAPQAQQGGIGGTGGTPGAPSAAIQMPPSQPAAPAQLQYQQTGSSTPTGVVNPGQDFFGRQQREAQYQHWLTLAKTTNNPEVMATAIQNIHGIIQSEREAGLLQLGKAAALGNSNAIDHLVGIYSTNIANEPLGLKQFRSSDGQMVYSLADADGHEIPGMQHMDLKDLMDNLYRPLSQMQTQLAIQNSQKFNEAYQAAAGKAQGEMPLEQMKIAGNVAVAQTHGQSQITVEEMRTSGALQQIIAQYGLAANQIKGAQVDPATGNILLYTNSGMGNFIIPSTQANAMGLGSIRGHGVTNPYGGLQAPPSKAPMAGQ